MKVLEEKTFFFFQENPGYFEGICGEFLSRISGGLLGEIFEIKFGRFSEKPAEEYIAEKKSRKISRVIACMNFTKNPKVNLWKIIKKFLEQYTKIFYMKSLLNFWRNSIWNLTKLSMEDFLKEALIKFPKESQKNL